MFPVFLELIGNAMVWEWNGCGLGVGWVGTGSGMGTGSRMGGDWNGWMDGDWDGWIQPFLNNMAPVAHPGYIFRSRIMFLG